MRIGIRACHPCPGAGICCAHIRLPVATVQPTPARKMFGDISPRFAELTDNVLPSRPSEADLPKVRNARQGSHSASNREVAPAFVFVCKG
jgi:hypothetical protein